jgi:ribonuclease BN (tRNA processing enzyme)
MIRLNCLGSSSSGNCYILSTETEAIILEAGVKFSEVQKALNFNLSKVKAVIISHLHGDHSKYICNFVAAGIPVLSDESVFKHYGIDRSNCIIAKNQHDYKFGDFLVKPFSVEHDVPNFGFLLNHPEMGKTVFMTDTGEIDYSFKNLSNIIVEANFSEEIIYNNVMKGIIHPVHEERVRKSHLSIEKCVEWLSYMDLSRVNNIVLIHLSSQNSDADLFKKIVSEKFCKNTHIAGKGLDVEFGKTPF